MGWDTPPVPWREFERRLSWGGNKTGGTQAPQPRPVTRLPVGNGSPAANSARPADGGPAASPGPAWAELHCHSSYSFLDGASSPADLVAEAAARGLTALAIIPCVILVRAERAARRALAVTQVPEDALAEAVAA